MDVDISEPRGTKRTAAEAGLSSRIPRRIKALDQDVINKIAAGEIIVAPVNALKEMMENSIDAGATSIEVLVRDGGLKLLQITDNGHGIDKEDLSILCERFTTSKLKDFDDLLSIGTYGFRGEALASISHIAHLKVTTKTAGSSCAWQAHYLDGKLTSPKPGQSSDPKPCAGRPGTQITVEDLFYNIPNRRRAFRSPSEEHTKILEIVSRYAVHCEHVAFSVKKHGDSGAAFSVAIAASKIDRIKQAHGTAVAKDLIEFATENARWGFKASGYCSNASYSGKRTTILLFINNRAVESSTVKKAIEQAYAAFLPKGGHPFVYLSLDIEPSRVDVNVHPTKREVHFLDEDEVVDLVCAEIRDRLVQVDASRTIKTQSILPTISPAGAAIQQDNFDDESAMIDTTGRLPRTPATKKPNENNLVRTDSKLRKITSMLPPALTPFRSRDNEEGDLDDAMVESAAAPMTYTTKDRQPVNVRLTSVKHLRALVRDQVHPALTEAFACLTYVGLIDPHRRLAAMQSGVKLYLVDYGLISNELFYQIGLTDFGNFGAIQLTNSSQPPLKLLDLLLIAAKAETEHNPSEADPPLDPNILAERVYDQLYKSREMLREYFSLDIDDQGNLLTIPLLVKNYIPPLAKLPTFLLRLGPYVNWTDEEECFRTFLVELAAFYVFECLRPLDDPAEVRLQKQQLRKQRPKKASANAEDVDMEDTQVEEEQELPITAEEEKEDAHYSRRKIELEYALEHVLFPAIRARILGTKGMQKGVREMADLKGLYRVFERC